MPELPEAEVVACQLRSRIVGAIIKDCWVGRADIVREGLSTVGWYRGARITAVDRRGKCLVFSLSRDQETRYIVGELGMTGRFLFKAAGERLPQHTHFTLYLDDGAEPEVRYWNPRRFGRIYLLDRQGLDHFIARRFGLDPLAMTKEEFVRLLRTRRGRLKPLLMHQQVLAGIGNIYANEILFRAGLHPYRPANRLRRPAAERLYRAVREVLEEAIRYGGSSVRDFFAPDGTEGRYKQRHLVYGKEGQPCPNGCGRRIRRLGGERSSFYCPSCQQKNLW